MFHNAGKRGVNACNCMHGWCLTKQYKLRSTLSSFLEVPAAPCRWLRRWVIGMSVPIPVPGGWPCMNCKVNKQQFRRSDSHIDIQSNNMHAQAFINDSPLLVMWVASLYSNEFPDFTESMVCFIPYIWKLRRYDESTENWFFRKKIMGPVRIWSVYRVGFVMLITLIWKSDT